MEDRVESDGHNITMRARPPAAILPVARLPCMVLFMGRGVWCTDGVQNYTCNGRYDSGKYTVVTQSFPEKTRPFPEKARSFLEKARSNSRKRTM